MKAKFPELVELIQCRLRTGEYSHTDIPSERVLAEAFGVSHMTARRAVQKLILDGFLSRNSFGRLQLGEKMSATKKSLRLAFVLPAFQSPSLQKWYFALSKVVEAHDGWLRPVGFSSFHDPAITDALDGPYDGIFFVPPSHLPSTLEKRLERDKHRVVTIAHDLTHLGIPCLDSSHPRFISRLTEHLVGLGHSEIDCINTQPMMGLIDQRIASWRNSLEQSQVRGTLHNSPVEMFHAPDRQALRLARKLFKSSRFKATAMFTVTTAAAVGVMRAAYERGIVIGKDLSLCTCDSDAEDAALFTPSLTTLNNQELSICLDIGLEWILRGGKNWDWQMHIEPDDVPVWIGESTGPCPAVAGK